MTRPGTSDGYDIGETEDPSDAVLRAVATASEQDVLELPPLQSAVDVEALNELFDSPGIEVLRFAYHGFEVVVEPGLVRITE